MHPLLRWHDGYAGTSPEMRDEVRRLQALLVQHGLPVQVDGFFGNGTDEAVREFQRTKGLDDDGIVGPRTWAALESQPAPDDLSVEFPTTFSPRHVALTAQLAAAADYRALAEAAARRHDLPLCVIAGVASRESGWGLHLDPRGPAGTGDRIARGPRLPLRPGPFPPDGGFGRGLMQIDYDSHEFARTGTWQDPAQNLLYGASVLGNSHALLQRSLTLAPTDLMRAALAAYNCGPGNVLRALRSARDIDFFTAGRDYGRDVLNRAGWFLLHGWR
jgi:hypothetical protein